MKTLTLIAILAAGSLRLSAAPLLDAEIGNPFAGGSAVQNNRQVLMEAGGKDIWGASDQFHFAYRMMTGDFDVCVRVERLSPAQLYSRAGLMARETLAANSKHITFFAFSDNQARHNNNAGYELQYRAATADHSQAIYPTPPSSGLSPFLVSYPNVWLRLQRVGDVFTAYASTDGSTWTEFGHQKVVMSATVDVGLALTAHDPKVTASATFSRFGDT